MLSHQIYRQPHFETRHKSLKYSLQLTQGFATFRNYCDVYLVPLSFFNLNLKGTRLTSKAVKAVVGLIHTLYLKINRYLY